MSKISTRIYKMKMRFAPVIQFEEKGE